jgi:hypothetical protein
MTRDPPALQAVHAKAFANNFRRGPMSDFDKDRSEVDQIIEEAIRPHLQLRPLTPALLRQVAEVWGGPVETASLTQAGG